MVAEGFMSIVLKEPRAFSTGLNLLLSIDTGGAQGFAKRDLRHRLIKKLIVSAAFLILILPTATLHAREPSQTGEGEFGIFYVDGSVSASGDGISWATAFKTIGEAVNSVKVLDNAEIWIKSGQIGRAHV